MAKKVELPTTTLQDNSKKLLRQQLDSEALRDTHYNAFQTLPVLISSGSLKLDNYVKIKTGGVLRMGGPAEVGKTSQSMLFAENFMKTMPKAKTFYINAEAKFGEEIRKRTGMKFTKNPDDWDYGSVFIFDCNCFDTICDVLVSQFQQIHNDGGHLCVIVDSVDMLRLKSSFGAKVSDGKKPAGINFLTKEMFRHLSHLIQAYNGMLIMITQYSATFKIDQYEKEAPNLMDGNQTHALNHQSSYALYYRPRTASSYIKEEEKEKPDPIKNKILGVNVKIDVRKSATDETGYVLEIPIRKGRVGNCIWVEKELFDALFLYNLVTRKGAWITLSPVIMQWLEQHNKPIIEENEAIAKANKAEKDPTKHKPLKPLLELKDNHNGMEKFSDYFENNQPALKWLVEKVRLWHA